MTIALPRICTSADSFNFAFLEFLLTCLPQSQSESYILRRQKENNHDSLTNTRTKIQDETYPKHMTLWNALEKTYAILLTGVMLQAPFRCEL